MEAGENETGEVISVENCEPKTTVKRTWCCSLPVCTVRIRIAILLALFCVQAPFILYYMSSVDLSNTLILKSYRTSLRIFSDYTNDSYSTGNSKVAANASTTVFNTTDNASIRLSTSKMYKNNTLSGAVSSESNHLSTTSTTAKSTTKTTSTVPKNIQIEKDGAILPFCPEEPPNLQGRLEVSFKNPPETFAQIENDNTLVKEGGHGKPPYCKARQKVAIIIPFRDRSEHLRYFLQYMHPTLQRQQVDYQIFIINQIDGGKFNRAKLMNIGFTEALKIYPFECFAFHDVDLVLEDDRCLYWCSDKPRHMSAAVDKFNYVLPYAAIFGGVVLVSKEQTEKGNGFSNLFWGWGGEDDDFRNRLTLSGFKIIRYPNNIARYKMITHKREKGNEPNPKRFDMIQKTRTTMKTDGLNSLDYKVINIAFEPTYTNITVDVFPPR